MGIDTELETTIDALRAAGCIAAEDEAALLVEAAAGDRARLRDLVERRRTGEPLAWLVGSVRFCGETVRVHPGVYVPRWQSEPLSVEAAARLPERGLAVDLCTGAGAIAVVRRHRRPGARVVATDIDPVAVACARANGVEVLEGDLAAPLPGSLLGRADVVTAVVPYVPTDQLRLLPRDVVAHEPRHALDGGEDGTALLVRAAHQATRLLHPGGSLLLELGGDQATQLEPVLVAAGYGEIEERTDDDGDLRAIVARLGRPGRDDG
ncbi:MAG: N5-glutamine methyltransferase family protein [Acidimicrobiales bacterium]